MHHRTGHRVALHFKVEGPVSTPPVVATIFDVTTEGCSAEVCGRSLPIGTPTVFRLATEDEVAGQVAWWQGNLIGVRFHAELDAETLAFLSQPTAQH